MPKKVSILNEALNRGNCIFLDQIRLEYEDKAIQNELLIYQDIISMWFQLRLQGNSQDYFRVTDIGNYLIQCHRPFVHEFNGSRMSLSNRVESKRSYIEKRIMDLLKMNIVYFVEQAESKKRNRTMTSTYSFTLQVMILSWLVNYERMYAIEEQERYFRLFTNELLPLISKTDNGIMTKLIIDYYSEALKQHEYDLIFEFFENIFDRFNSNKMYYLHLTFLKLVSKTETSCRIFQEILNNYDKKNKEAILFRIKMILECAIGFSMYGHFKAEWELVHYRNIANPYIVTVLISCDKCGTKSATAFNILAFLGVETDDVLQNNSLESGQAFKDFKCRRCESRSACIYDFFNLLDSYYLVDNELRYVCE
jgi:hypothetical protein